MSTHVALKLLKDNNRKKGGDVVREGEKTQHHSIFMHYHSSSYLLSEDNPAVAIKDDELMKTKSLAVLLWHCQV